MKKNIKLIYKLTIVFTLIIITVTVQDKIGLLRYDDDFSRLKDDSLRKGFDYLKMLPLGKKNYISFGGELREQVQVYRNINFGDVPPIFEHISQNQLNHRLMVHSDIQLGDRFRFFVQLNNTLRFLNNNPVVPEVDENQLSLHQIFGEIKLKYWIFRVGRQEISYGNHRLITVREGPNTRKTFDGIVIKRTLSSGRIDLFATSPTISKQYLFDDENFKEGLIGVYGTQYLLRRAVGLDYFAVHFQSKLRKYNYQSGFENRQTYGIRMFSNFKKLSFEVEGTYQSGKFADQTIGAYNVFADINTMVLPAFRGVIGFTFNEASGDRNNKDNKLNTYNLLFAKPAYGLAIPIGSTNIKSLSSYLKINPVPKLNLLTQVFFLARNNNQDGTYSPGMIQNRPKPGLNLSTEKTLGKLYLIETNYQSTKNLSLAFDASFFKALAYPKATGRGKDVKYLSLKSTFKF